MDSKKISGQMQAPQAPMVETRARKRLARETEESVEKKQKKNIPRLGEPELEVVDAPAQSYSSARKHVRNASAPYEKSIPAPVRHEIVSFSAENSSDTLNDLFFETGVEVTSAESYINRTQFERNGNNVYTGANTPRLFERVNYLETGNLTLFNFAQGIAQRSKKPVTVDLPSVESLNEVFDSVSSRTTLLAASIKYEVTLGEIMRRISPPESLHISILNGILRKAKSKDGGKQLRSKLGAYGADLALGRRKTIRATSFTSFTEGEAVSMGVDFAMLCEQELDIGRLASVFNNVNGRTLNEVLEFKRQLKNIIDFTEQLASIMKSIGMHPGHYDRSFSPATQAAQHFGLVTHGFGPIALLSSFTALKGVARSVIDYLDKELEQVWKQGPNGMPLMTTDVRLVCTQANYSGPQQRPEQPLPFAQHSILPESPYY